MVGIVRCPDASDLVPPPYTFDVGDGCPLCKTEKIGIVLVVAAIFGLVNAVVKPIVQVLAIPLYILTLGLIHIVINALMLELTSWITHNTTHWGLQVDDFFWSAILGAIVVSIVGWLIALVMKEPVK